MKIKKAVIPAAGLGTRFLPVSKSIPKEMVPVLARPLISFAVEEAIAAGIDDILIVTSRGKSSMGDYFDYDPDLLRVLEGNGWGPDADIGYGLAQRASVHFIRQGQPLGLGHAVLMAKSHVQARPFAVLLPDEIFFGQEPAIGQLASLPPQEAGNIIALRPVPRDEIQRYGVAELGESQADGLWRTPFFVEKPVPDEAPSNMAVVGRYILQPEIFGILEGLPPGHGGEIQLTDAIAVLAKEGQVWGKTIQGERHDAGNPLGHLKASLALGLRDDQWRQGCLTILAELFSEHRSIWEEVAAAIEEGNSDDS